MSKDLLLLDADIDPREAFTTLDHHNRRYAPAVDAEGRLAGILTRKGALRATLYTPAGPWSTRPTGSADGWRTVGFDGCDDALTAEMGAMRFPPSSTALQHYIDLVGLKTRPFPNPLAPDTPSTVVDLKGESHYARTIDDLPPVYREVADAWNACLEEGADFSDMNRAIRERDAPRIREIWARLVEKLDNQTFYGFLCDSSAFASFRHREIFGQVGFGTGGWDTDFPNSILEILRVVYTEADDHHRGIVGGSQQLPLRLWEREPEKIVHWPQGTSLSSLHGGCTPARPRAGCTGQRATASW
ncbi:hypothetical protein SANTM175S_03922 [Streptomyces antimycoticus]